MSTEMIPFQDIEKMGKAIAGSGLFGVKTAEQAVALMLVAQALGKHPALAAMEYNIIQGRPAKKADAMLSDFQAAGGKTEWHVLTDIKVEATFTHPQGGSAKIDWDIDRAKKANLYDKEGSMYKKYPRSMLRSRVIAEGVRTVYPAATGGVRAVEEFDDEPDTAHVVDTKKSRLDNIIEATAEEVKPNVDTKKDVRQEPDKNNESTPSGDEKSHKEKQDKQKKSDIEHKLKLAPVELQKGEKLAQGYILEIPKTANVEKDGKPTPKYSFKMTHEDGSPDAKYGTFDKDMFEKMCAVLDIQNQWREEDNPNAKIILNIIYTERNKDGKILRDIVKFTEASARVVPI